MKETKSRKRPTKKSPPNRFGKFFKTRFGKVILISFLVLLAALVGFFFQVLLLLPNITNLSSFTPFESTEILSADGKVLASLHKEEDRVVVPLSKISPSLQEAVVTAEDGRFYQHHGVDFMRIGGAFIANILHMNITEGGSTITQQLAKNLFLSSEKTLTRKIAEVIIALEIERKFSKDEILELYLNQVYWGHNVYGIEKAAQVYFAKHAYQLDLAESAMLAGIISGPELYSPHKDFKSAKRNQKIILARMVKLGYITDEEAGNAKRKKIQLSTKNLNKYKYVAPYFVTYIIDQLVKKYGEQMVYNGGMRVYTTLDSKMQKDAEETAKTYMAGYGKGYNFSQCAILSLDPKTGFIKAMVGGADFDKSEYNRTTQAKRQPGSSFKPFVYAAAVEQGFSPEYILMDTRMTLPGGVKPWIPMNYDRRFRGAVTMRRALEMSLNIPAIKVLQLVGIPSAIDMAHRLGIKSEISPNLTLVLGSSEMTMLEMVSAYGVFANRGRRVEPTGIKKIELRNGTILETYQHNEKKVIEENVVSAMVDMMRGVLLRGTGRRAYFGRDAAAKTGTTDDYRDAWFIGFTPELVTGIWVGNDNNASMRGVAEVGVCPLMWRNFMSKALANKPYTRFKYSTKLMTVRICTESNLLATEFCPKEKTKGVTVRRGKGPTGYCGIHAPKKEQPKWLEDVIDDSTSSGEAKQKPKLNPEVPEVLEEPVNENRPPEWLEE